jgi:dCTP deaminase
MFLSNKTIKEYIDNGKILIRGNVEIETMGVSVHLGNELLIMKPNQTIDSTNLTKIEYDLYNLLDGPYTLKPNEFLLGVTKENVRTDKDILTMLDGRSTYARSGMTIHLSAMILDGLPFSNENSVLEIKNLGNSNIVLHCGEKIGTYLFAQLSTPIDGDKESVYSNQNKVTPPQFA